MSLLDPGVQREPVHTRKIRVDGYRRDDGLWNIEGHLTDTRQHAIASGMAPRSAGAPLHEMRVRLTVDDALTILSAEAQTIASPYPDTCGNITPDYARLAGVRIEPGFRREVGRLFGGVRGCTHLSELLGNIGAVAMQTVGVEHDKLVHGKPRRLDGCHALDTAGPTVRYYYPAWFRKPA